MPVIQLTPPYFKLIRHLTFVNKRMQTLLENA